MLQGFRGPLVAAAIASLAVLGAAPAGAASMMAPQASAEGAILRADYSYERHGDTHNAFQEEYNEGIGRFSPYRRYYRHNRFYPRALHFGYPFRAMPPYHSYHRGYYGNCFSTWDGQLLCR
jgi:hypothetical protein